MTYEILYTSAPSGLKPGSSGYCTVKGSRGIPSPTLDLLESLSGYRHVFTPGTPEAAHNPVNWGHYLLRISGRMEHVLSRVSDCEPDYTGRSNKLAHHMVVDSTSCPAGPAWLLGQRGWMTDRWDGQVEQLSTVRTAPATRRAPGRCTAWENQGADPGWAGAMAESFLADPDRKVFVIYRPGTNILPLFEEALSLLPENRRWDVTFATYGPALPSTVECLWSGIVAGSPEVQQSRRFVNALRIDLTRPEPFPGGGALVELARTGIARKQIVPPPPATRLTPSRPVTVAPPIEFSSVATTSQSTRYPAPPGSDDPLAEPEPPSLPSRSRREASGSPWILVAAAVVFFGFVVGAATLLILNRPAGPSDDKTIAQRDEDTAAGSGHLLKENANVAATDAGTPRIVAVNPDAPPNAIDPNMKPTVPVAEPVPTAASKESEQPVKENPAMVKSTGGEAPKSETANGKPATPAEEKPAPQSGTSGDSAVALATPPKSAQREPPQQIVSTAEPVLTKKVDEPVRVDFPPATRLRSKTFSQASLWIPRGRSEKDRPNAHDRIEQSFEKGKLSVLLIDDVGIAKPQFHVDAEIGMSEELSVLVTAADKLEPAFREALLHGVLHLREPERDADALVYLTPPKPTFDPPVFDEKTLQLRIPTELRKFLGEIEPEDLRVSGITLSLVEKSPETKGDGKASSETTLKPLVSGEANAKDGKLTMAWDLSSHSGGLIKAIEMASVPAVSDNVLKLTYKYSSGSMGTPTNLKTEELNLKPLHLKLDSAHDKMKDFVRAKEKAYEKANEKLKESLSALSKAVAEIRPDVQKVPDEAAIKAAEDRLRGALDEFLNQERETSPITKEQFKAHREGFMKEIDAYLADLREWIPKRSGIDRVKGKIRLVSASVGYVVRPIKAAKDAQKVAKLPDSTEQIVDIWSIQVAK